MANTYVNKVVQSNGTTLIDISDTTAVASDVASGKYFYLATGEKVEGNGSGGGGSGLATVTVMDSTITATDQDTSGYVVWIKTQWVDDMSETLVDDTNYIVTLDGTPYLCHANAIYGGDDVYCGDIQIVWGTPSNAIYPFAIGSYASGNVQWMIGDNQSHSVKVERVISMNDSTTFITKTITANGTYSAEDDDADGYSSVTVNVPSGASNIVTGTFKGTTTGAAMDVDLAYTGNGYPVAIIIYPKEGAYNSNSSAYALIQRYASLWFNAVKSFADVAPNYDNSGTDDQYTITNRTKNSSSNSTSYSTNIGPDIIVASGGNAAQTVQNVVKLKSKTKMSVYIASSSYGFPANIEFTYHVIYSS